MDKNQALAAATVIVAYSAFGPSGLVKTMRELAKQGYLNILPVGVLVGACSLIAFCIQGPLSALLTAFACSVGATLSAVARRECKSVVTLLRDRLDAIRGRMM